MRGIPFALAFVGLDEVAGRQHWEKFIQIRDFINESGRRVHCYELSPPPPGWRRAAAVDLLVVLGAAGSIASLASLLWLAYDKFIGRQKEPASDAGIIVNVDPERGLSFHIGKDLKDKETFITVFTQEVSRFQQSAEPKEFSERLMAEIASGVFVPLGKKQRTPKKLRKPKRLRQRRQGSGGRSGGRNEGRAGH